MAREGDDRWADQASINAYNMGYDNYQHNDQIFNIPQGPLKTYWRQGWEDAEQGKDKNPPALR